MAATTAETATSRNAMGRMVAPLEDFAVANLDRALELCGETLPRQARADRRKSKSDWLCI